MIPEVYISEISRFQLVFVAEQVSLCLAWSETPEDTFCHVVAHVYLLTVFSNSCLFNLNEPRHEKTCLREFPTRSDSNWPAQLQKLA